MELRNIAEEVVASRNSFKAVKSRPADFCNDLMRKILKGDMTTVANCIRAAFGAEALNTLLTDGTGGKVRGFEIKDGAIVMAPEGVKGVAAMTPYDAANVILVAYAQATSLRSVNSDYTLGAWARPVKSGQPLKGGKGVKLVHFNVDGIALPYAIKVEVDKWSKRVRQVGQLLGIELLEVRASGNHLCDYYDVKTLSEVIGLAMSAGNDYSAGESIYNALCRCYRARGHKEEFIVTENGGSDYYEFQDCGLFYMDRNWTREDAIFAAHLYSMASTSTINLDGMKSSKKFIKVEARPGKHIVWFENEAIEIRENGVYDTRDRRYQNILLSVATDRVSHPDDLTLVNSYGAFVLSLINATWSLNEARKETGMKEPIGSWWRGLSDWFPMDSEHEIGAISEGARGDYLEQVALPYYWEGMLPFGINAIGATTKGITGNQIVKAGGNKHFLGKAALTKYNLIQSPKGDIPFMNASWGLLRFDILSEVTRNYMAKAILERLYGDVRKGLVEVMFKGNVEGASLYSTESLLAQFGHLCILLSTKKQKFIKRTTHCAPSSAQVVTNPSRWEEASPTDLRAALGLTGKVSTLHISHAEKVGGQLRAFCNYESNVGPDVGHRYKVGYFPYLVNSPGVVFLLADMLAPFIVEHNVQEEIDLYVADHKQWEFILGQVEVETKYNRNVADYSSKSSYNGPSDDPYAVHHSGVFVKKDDTVLRIPFEVKGERFWQDIKVENDCFVQSIEWWTVTYDEDTLIVVQINDHDIQRNAKLRMNFKALVSRPSAALWSKNGKGIIEHGLNEALSSRLGLSVPEVDLLFTGDADKSKDLLVALLDIAAETEVGNGGNGLVPLNEHLIDAEVDACLLYHEVLAVLGLYDEFYAKFFSDYGRPMWFHTRDLSNNALRAVRELYTNRAGDKTSKWMTVSYPELTAACPEVVGYNWGCSPEELTIIASNPYGDGRISDINEIFVFGVGEHECYEGIELPEFYYQRTFGFIGNQKGDVYMNAKIELCSVDQTVVSGSPLMAAIPRCLEVGIGNMEPAPEAASRLIDEYANKNREQWKAVKTMALGGIFMAKEGAVLPEVALFGTNGTINPEVLPYLLRAEGIVEKAVADDKSLIKDLAKVSTDVVYLIPTKKGQVPLYLPAIVWQSSNANSSNSLTGLVYKMLRNALLGITAAKVALLGSRIKGMIQNLAKSSNIEKAMFMGRPSSQNKLLGVFGLPLSDYTVIKYSKVFWADVEAAVKAGVIEHRNEWRKLVGEVVIISRAPMPFGMPLYWTPVDENSPKAKLINDSQAGIGAIACEFLAADHDGDGYTVTFLGIGVQIKVLGYDMLMQVIKDRTGKDPVGQEMGEYIADHFMAKGWKPNQITKPALLTKDHLGGFDMIPSKTGMVIDEFNWDKSIVNGNGDYCIITNNLAAVHTQGTHVAYTHLLAVTLEVASGLAQAGREVFSKRDPQFEEVYSSTFLSKPLPLPVYELYEGGALGGLQWNSYAAVRLLNCLRTKEVVELQLDVNGELKDHASFKDNLTGGSLNSNFATSYIEGAQMIREVERIAKAREFGKEISELAGEQIVAFKSGDYSLSSRELENSATFIKYVSYMMYMLMGGRWSPKVGKTKGGSLTLNGHAAISVMLWLSSQSMWKELSKVSITARLAHLWLDECLAVKCPELKDLIGIPVVNNRQVVSIDINKF